MSDVSKKLYNLGAALNELCCAIAKEIEGAAPQVQAEVTTTAPAEVPTEATKAEEPKVKSKRIAKVEAKTEAPKITIDAIKAVIVKKMQGNPELSDKIRKLLEATGTSKLSELPEAKYTEFLSSIEALQ